MPTQNDADLILRFYEMRREEKLRAARAWFVKNVRPASLEELQKLCPPGSDENAYFRQVTSFWEMLAGLVVTGLVDAELFYQSNREMLLVWTRIRPIVDPMRAAFKDPTAYRNMERVAHQFIEWMNKQGPEMYSAFAERIK